MLPRSRLPSRNPPDRRSQPTSLPATSEPHPPDGEQRPAGSHVRREGWFLGELFRPERDGHGEHQIEEDLEPLLLLVIQVSSPALYRRFGHGLEVQHTGSAEHGRYPRILVSGSFIVSSQYDNRTM